MVKLHKAQLIKQNKKTPPPTKEPFNTSTSVYFFGTWRVKLLLSCQKDKLAVKGKLE